MTQNPLLSKTLGICAATLLSFASSEAATIAFDSTINTTASAGSIFSNGVGHVFQVNTATVPVGQSVVVSQLGIEGYFGGSATAEGLVIRLWDTANSTTPLASYTFTPSDSFTVVDYAHGSYDGRRYLGTIAPITLNSGSTYVIAAYGFGGAGAGERSYIGGGSGAPVQAVASQITFLQERYSTTANTMPATNDGTSGILKYGGPTFTFDVVPEPSIALLGGLGVLTLLRRRREF